MQPGYAPQGQQQQATVVIATPIVHVGQVIVGEHPVQMNCPSCHAAIVTGVSYETGTLTWIICGALVLFGYVSVS